jgi:hypothetical protein
MSNPFARWARILWRRGRVQALDRKVWLPMLARAKPKTRPPQQ